MNAFSLILLAFPLYLATKGRLVPTYTGLATSGSGNQTTAASTTSSGVSTSGGNAVTNALGINPASLPSWNTGSSETDFGLTGNTTSSVYD